jgi:hypothetical protein
MAGRSDLPGRVRTVLSQGSRPLHSDIFLLRSLAKASRMVTLLLQHVLVPEDEAPEWPHANPPGDSPCRKLR